MYSAADVASLKVFCHFFAVIHASLGPQQVTVLLWVLKFQTTRRSHFNSSCSLLFVLVEDSVTDTGLEAGRNWAGSLCSLLCRSGETYELQGKQCTWTTRPLHSRYLQTHAVLPSHDMQEIHRGSHLSQRLKKREVTKFNCGYIGRFL